MKGLLIRVDYLFGRHKPQAVTVPYYVLFYISLTFASSAS